MTAVVYFAECSATGRVKIGTTEDLTRRIATLNANNCAPVRLVAAMTGGSDVEKHVHELFSDKRAHGEWFESSPELWAFIEQICHGSFSLDVVRLPAQKNSGAFADLLKQASADLKRIGATWGLSKINAQIRHAAEQCGLSHSRTFDIWYCKARQITPAEIEAIGNSSRRLADGVGR